MASQETPSNKMESEEPPKTTETAPDVSRESTADEKPKEEEYPKGIKLVIITACLFSSLFLVSLDRMIIATAVPKITDEFHSAGDIGWYSSAFQLTACAFQLLYGKLYATMNIRAVFIASIVIFEAGSALCGAAPSSTAFIIGRALAGMGSGGIFSGAMTMIVYTVPLHKRPAYQGMFGAISGISSAAGPLLGGVFTSKATWRWCFYINLPFGALAVAGIWAFLRVPPSKDMPLRQKLAQLDIYGTLLILPGVVCLVLALEWGGSTYSWSNARIIALIVIACLLLIGFLLVQIYLPKTATLPPRVLRQRSILSACFSCICRGSSLMIYTYYIPVWLQAIKGLSAVESGIQTLPMLVPLFASTMLTGFLVGKLGYYTPPAIVGDCIAIIGGALLYTLSDASSKAQYAGYQAVYGVGVGMALSSPNMAAQTVLPRDQVAIGISLLFFAQLLAPSILVPAAQTVLTSQLRRRLADIPGLNAGVLSDGGATSIVDVDPAIRGDVIHGYALALRRVFLVGLVIVCVSIFGSATLEWKSTRKAADEKKAAAAQAEEGKMDEKRASTASATEAGDAADRDQPKDTESVAAEGKDQDEKAAPAKK